MLHISAFAHRQTINTEPGPSGRRHDSLQTAGWFLYGCKQYLHCGIASSSNRSCSAFSLCLPACLFVCSYECEKQRDSETEAEISVPCFFLFPKSPVFRRWHLTKEEGMNRCTLFTRLTGVPESSLHFTDKQAGASFQISSEPCTAPPPSPRPSASGRPTVPAGGTSPATLGNVLRILLKKATLCAVLSEV